MKKIISILRFSNKNIIILVWQKMSKLLTRLETSTLTCKLALKSKSIHQNTLQYPDNFIKYMKYMHKNLPKTSKINLFLIFYQFNLT